MQPLKMLSSMASRELLRELAVQFEQCHGQSVLLEAAGGIDVTKRLRTGELADVVVLARNSIDALIREGVLRAESVTDIAQSGIGVAVSATSPLPDISSEAAVRVAVESAASLSYSTGPSGVYLENKFAAWGLLETLKGRIVVPPPGTPVGSLVANGRAALGFQQLSELQGVTGLRVVGLLPAEIQLVTTFSGATTSACANVLGASQLLAFMASQPTAEVKQRFGMEAC